MKKEDKKILNVCKNNSNYNHNLVNKKDKK